MRTRLTIAPNPSIVFLAELNVESVSKFLNRTVEKVRVGIWIDGVHIVVVSDDDVASFSCDDVSLALYYVGHSLGPDSNQQQTKHPGICHFPHRNNGIF